MLCGSRTSEMFTSTFPARSLMLKGLPPYCGMSESRRVTRAPVSRSLRAKLDPMKPHPACNKDALAQIQALLCHR
jgi:hypothetical protein